MMASDYRASFVRIALAIALAGGVLASGAQARRHDPPTGLAKIAYGKLAPDFAFDGNSSPASLSALRGKPVVLNFWATYCEPCTDELRTFARLHATYGDAVTLVAISDRTPELADALLRERGVDAISVIDPEHKLFDLYGVVPIPVTLVIAPDGSVRHVSVGELDWPELQSAVDAVRTPAEDRPSGPQ